MIWDIIIFKSQFHIFQINGKKYHLLLLIPNIYFYKKYRKNINYNNFYNCIEKMKSKEININNYFLNGQIGNQTVFTILTWHFYKFCRVELCSHSYFPINLALIKRLLSDLLLIGSYKHPMEWFKKVYLVGLRHSLRKHWLVKENKTNYLFGISMIQLQNWS